MLGSFSIVGKRPPFETWAAVLRTSGGGLAVPNLDCCARCWRPPLLDDPPEAWDGITVCCGWAWSPVGGGSLGSFFFTFSARLAICDPYAAQYEWGIKPSWLFSEMTYTQSFSWYKTCTTCPLLTSNSSSTQGVKSWSTTIFDSGPRPFSFSIPTLTSVSIEADPVMRPIDGMGPDKESSSKAEKKIVWIGWFQRHIGKELNWLTLLFLAPFDPNWAQKGHNEGWRSPFSIKCWERERVRKCWTLPLKSSEGWTLYYVFWPKEWGGRSTYPKENELLPVPNLEINQSDFWNIELVANSIYLVFFDNLFYD